MKKNPTTVSQILSLFPNQPHSDATMLAAADDRVDQLLCRAALIVANAEMDHFNLIDEIARTTDADDQDRYSKQLDTFAPIEVEGNPAHACDVANNYYTPKMVAAYSLGLALGLRLAGRK